LRLYSTACSKAGRQVGFFDSAEFRRASFRSMGRRQAWLLGLGGARSGGMWPMPNRTRHPKERARLCAWLISLIGLNAPREGHLPRRGRGLWAPPAWRTNVLQSQPLRPQPFRPGDGRSRLAPAESRAIILSRSSLAAAHSRRGRPGRWRAWQRHNTTQPARRHAAGGFWFAGARAGTWPTAAQLGDPTVESSFSRCGLSLCGRLTKEPLYVRKTKSA
jgi:hypothetical protein